MKQLRYYLILLLLLPCTQLRAQPPGEEYIREMLSAQVREWNRGNIAGYMRGYWESDSLVFIGKTGATYGYQATLARYRKSYPDTAHMGKLRSTVLRLRMLSPDYAYVTGQWALQRSAGDLKGHFTLLIRRIGKEWLIIEDHSS